MDLINNILQVAMPTIIIVVIAVLTYIGIVVYPSFIAWLKIKLGAARYNHLKTVALDIWGLVEDYKRLNPEFALSLLHVQGMFANELKKTIPSVTDSEISQIRETVSGIMNKDKIAIIANPQEDIPDDLLKVAEDVAPQVVAPILKYVTSDGIELQPVLPVPTATV